MLEQEVSAKLLKSISKGTKLLVPIGEELSLLQDYFTIQSYRYGGTITMDIQVDDESILDLHIIKFKCVLVQSEYLRGYA